MQEWTVYWGAKLKRVSALLAFSLLFYSAAPAQPFDSAPTLHLILAADTNDIELGRSSSTDATMMRGFAKGLVESRVYQRVQVTSFEGDQFTASNLRSAVQGLRSRRSDLVILYVTGHGQSSRSGSDWPLLAFNNGEEVEANELVSLLNRQPARYLALFEACNGSDADPPRAPASSGFIAREVERLFLDLTGPVIVSSSEPGYVSYARKPDGGSLFTLEFLRVVGDVLTSHLDQSGWSDILDRVSKGTDALARQHDLGQRPTYKVP